MRRGVVTSLAFPPQGRPGATGPAGPIGPSGQYGYVVFTERAVEASDVFAPGVPGQIIFEPTPSLTRNTLMPPFAGHLFWANNKIVPRAMGDTYRVIVNLIVVAEAIGGLVLLEADVGSPLGPTGSAVEPLAKGASLAQRVTLTIQAIDVLDNFMANGAVLRLTSNVPLTVTSESIRIEPRPAAGG